ncbi:hypothetical protein QJQ45_010132 [Haematococcus lacustris]|nr:hypothetical protein QJQ45_010132 [Haematococcus lacustris]
MLLSVQGVRPSQDGASSQDPVAKPKGPIIITGANSPGNPRPELDWAAWDNMLFLGQPSAQVVLINLTLANMPVGPSNESPHAFFTAAGFMATGAFYPINKLEVINCTLLLPEDEAAWWTWVGANVSDTQYVWTLALYKFQAEDAVLNSSMTVRELVTHRKALSWRDVSGPSTSLSAQRATSTNAKAGS